MAVHMVDVDSVEVKDTSIELYKPPAKGVTDRVGFTLLNPKSGKVAIIPVEYVSYYDPEDDKYRKILLPQDDEELRAYILEKTKSEPIIRYVSVIIKYHTNKDGKMVKPLTGELMAIRLTPAQLKTLQKIGRAQGGLHNTDLYVDSDNPDYFAMNFVATGKSYWKIGKLVTYSDSDVEDEEVEYEEWTPEEIEEKSRELLDLLPKVVAYPYSKEALKDLFDDVEEDDDAYEEEYEDVDDIDEDTPKKAKSKKATVVKKKPAKKQEPEEDEFEEDFDDIDDSFED